MYRPSLSALLGACGALLLPSPSEAQEARPKDDRECLTVELMMFSGRPRPRYLICEDAEKRQALDLLAEADEEKPAEKEFPDLPSDPSYQGILVTLPGKEGAVRSRLILRKGFVKPGGGKAIRMDKGRKLETFFLKRSLKENDVSNSHAKGAPIGDISERILADVEREADSE